MKNPKMLVSGNEEHSGKKSPFKLANNSPNFKQMAGTKTYQAFSPKTPTKSPKNCFLNKKRKNSDLNLNNESSGVKSKNIDHNSSPHTCDTKITNYFHLQKSSSYKKINSKQSLVHNKGNSTERLSLSECTQENTKKFSFAKKLDFEGNVGIINNELNKNDNFNNHLLIQSGNINFSKYLDEFSKNCPKFKKGEMLQDNNYSSEYAYLEYNKHQRQQLQPPELSEATLKLIEKSTQKTPKKVSKASTPQKNSNLNFNNLNSNNSKLKLAVKKIINNNKNSKINSPKGKKSTIVQQTEKILNSLSLKDRYEELINRELMLPSHYKILYKKLAYLDDSINHLKIDSMRINLKNINEKFHELWKSSISIDEFQQILFIVPHFFIYKWDNLMNDGGCLLYIDIPNDIKRRMEDIIYNQTTNFTQLQTFPYLPLNIQLSREFKDKRLSIFKKLLLQMTNEAHKSFLKNNNITSKLNPFKHRTWHHEFDIHNVPQIEKFKLIEKPKGKKLL
jgi:hypothetical protein